MVTLVKKELDHWLDGVDYSIMNSSSYVPSEFALTFMNFIKLVNGAEGEANKTPPFHLMMLDKVLDPYEYIVNLCFRGAAKTSVFMEYFTLYIATFGELPVFGDVSGMMYITDSMENGAKNARKNIETRYRNSEFLLEWIPKATFTDPYLEFQNKEGHLFGVKLFGAQTGIRGSKIFAKRPTIAVLDDLVADDDARSPTAMAAIKHTVYSGLTYALDPKRRKIIMNGTPFNKDDIMVEAVESGGWNVNVWPVCERFPCTEEEFVGAWEDRFSFDSVKAQYDFAITTGKVNSFMQEMMLRISSTEDRLVQSEEIRWYPRTKLLDTKHLYNFYITTDFATSGKKTADFSVIFVWAYNANGDWFWVDGICERQTMDKNVDQLFKYVLEYRPQAVGIEVTGQQGGFIPWLQTEMMGRNIWFSLASSKKDGSAGIRPDVDKLTRFNLVVPWFKTGKIYFPQELKTSIVMGRTLQQISLTTLSGIKGKDDCIDGISQLAYLKPWKPSEGLPSKEGGGIFDDDDDHFGRAETTRLSSYIV